MYLSTCTFVGVCSVGSKDEMEGTPKWSSRKRPAKKQNQNKCRTSLTHLTDSFGEGQKKHQINRWSRAAEVEALEWPSHSIMSIKGTTRPFGRTGKMKIVSGITNSFGHDHGDNHRISQWYWEEGEQLWNNWLIRSSPWKPSPNPSVMPRGPKSAAQWLNDMGITDSIDYTTSTPFNQSVVGET
jgi:hypothetical protein